MKRGYMDWNQELLPLEALKQRRKNLLDCAAAQGVAAVVVYGDVYSADELSYYVNYAPYWCNSAAVLTPEETYMVTGHNNRVNPWISSLTGLSEDQLLASGFQVPVRTAKSLKERFPEGGRIGIAGKYVMADVVKELKKQGFETVVLDGIIGDALKTADEAYRNTAAKAAEILEQAFGRGREEFLAGGTSKTTAAEIEYAARKNGAMDIVLYVSYQGRQFGLPVEEDDAGGVWTVYGLMQYLGVWVSRAETYGTDTEAVRRQLEAAARQLRPGKPDAMEKERGEAIESRAAADCEIAVKRVTADVISDLNGELGALADHQVVAVSAYEASTGIYLEKMYCVTDEGAVAL